MIVVRCRRGMEGCTPLTNAERVRRYEIAAARHVDPMDRAVRVAAGLALLARLTKLWKQPKRKRKPKHAKTTTTVVPIRRRA